VRQTVFYAVVTALLELPSTFLLYAYLARLAGLYAASSGLRRHLRVAALMVPAVVLASFGAFAATRGYRNAHAAPAVLALSGAFGALALGIAAWAASLVLTLAGVLIRRRVARTAGAAPVRTVYRELPGPTPA
jgi:hypothetical protein